MTLGKNEFPVKLRINDIVAITNKAADVPVPAVEDALNAGASLEDLRTVEVLLAYKEYLRERHVDAGFELEFN